MKKTHHFALLCVAAMALTGCGSEAGDADAGGTSSSPAVTSSTEPTSTAPMSEAPSSAPASAESSTGYSAEDLAAIIEPLTDAEGNSLTVLQPDQVERAMEAGEALVETANVTPEECSALVTGNLGAPAGSTYAAGSNSDITTSLTVISMDDPDALTDLIAASLEAAEACSTFELNYEGEIITSDIELLDVTTEGEPAFGALTTQTASTGEAQTFMTVSAVKGNLAASAVKLDAGAAPEEAQSELEQLVSEALTTAP